MGKKQSGQGDGGGLRGRKASPVGRVDLVLFEVLSCCVERGDRGWWANAMFFGGMGNG